MHAALRRSMAVMVVSVVALVASSGAASAAGFTDPMLFVRWNVNASTHIKKLNQDVAVPQGQFAALIDLKTGDLLGVLTLPPAHIQMKALGLLPLVDATVVMSETKPITGHVDFATTTVTTNASFNIHITSLTAAGLPVNLVGNQCTTSSPITLNLGGKVDLVKGSTFSGLYTIPPLQNCGALTPAINQLIPGPGNTFTATFAPPPA